MSKVIDDILCMSCMTVKKSRNFYASNEPMNKVGKIPYCKECLDNELGNETLDEVKAVLKMINRPYLKELWDDAVAKDTSGRGAFGNYLRVLNLQQYRDLTWEDSDVEDIEIEDIEHDLTKEEIIKLKKEWGMNFALSEIISFDNKYQDLSKAFPNKTKIHEEHLKSYCRQQTMSEKALANGNIDEADKLSKLAEKSAKLANIDLSKIKDGELSQGISTFGELALKVEQMVDIVPIMPLYMSKPQDEVDFIILEIVNYQRKLEGKPLVEYADLYEHYQLRLRKLAENNETLAEMTEEVLIDYKGGKKKVLTVNIDKIIEKRKKEFPNDKFVQNLDKWVKVLGHLRFYPDAWLDLLKPKIGGINLHPDQRLFLRVLARFVFVTNVFPRGWSKTFLQVISNIHHCVFYPDVKVAMTAQTQENASALVSDKYDEVMKSYPDMEKEVTKTSFQKDKAELWVTSRSRLDTLANAQSSKGQRRERLSAEESALINEELFMDALEPVVNIPRRTVGELSIVNPYELNGHISRFTTSTYKGVDEYEQNLIHLKNMRDKPGSGYYNLGASWRLPEHFGRGEPKHQILHKKETQPESTFNMNYESVWIGAGDSSIVSIRDVLVLRTLKNAELVGNSKYDYFLSMDVARSNNKGNANSIIQVLKLRRKPSGGLMRIDLVNTITVDASLTYQEQALELKKTAKYFDPITVVVDANGVGSGVVDNLLEEQFDKETGEYFGAWNTINDENRGRTKGAPDIIYALKSQSTESSNTDIINTFIDIVEKGQLRLLEKKDKLKDYDPTKDTIEEHLVPFVQTDLLIQEIANVTTHVKGNRITTGRISKSIQDDRFFSLAYGVWYIVNSINSGNVSTKKNILDFLLIN